MKKRQTCFFDLQYLYWCYPNPTLPTFRKGLHNCSFLFFCIGKRPLTPPKEQGFVDREHVEPVVTSPAEDPYEEFLKGQRKRQAV